MGAASSINTDTPDVQLVDFTSREQFLKDCNNFYDTMQSCDGTAQKARIYSVLNGLHQASEILNIFMLYCPEGRMSSKRFIDLCRDTKHLDKTFTSDNASTVFATGRNNYYSGIGGPPKDSEASDVNYTGFLYYVIPELASAKNIEEDIITNKLSLHHMPNPAVERKISLRRMNSRSLPTSPVKKSISNVFDEVEEKVEEKEEFAEEKTTEEKSEEKSANVKLHVRDVVQIANSDLDVNLALKNQAAAKIQNKFRIRLAKRVAFHLKQIKKGKRIKEAAIGPKMKPKVEKALKKVFQFYCPNDDIDREGFFALLLDGGIVGYKYLAVDVEYNFRETIAKVEAADTPRKYTAGVRYKKRFTFMVFKEIALCFVALSTGKKYDDVVDIILKSNAEA